MPSFNYAAYIGEAIESILGQTFEDLELIIVDDGSTDHSWDVIQRYAKSDSRIISIRQENQGPSAATNRALKEATGDFIAAQTSDDRSVDTRLEKQLSFLDGHSECDAVGTFVEEIDALGDVNPHGHYAAWFNVPVDMNDARSWIWKNKLASPTLMLRRSFFERFGSYDTDLVYTQDWEMWIRALSMGGKLAVLYDKLLQYRGHGDNLTHKNHMQCFWEYAYISSKTLHPWLLSTGKEALVVNNIDGFWRHELLPRLNKNERAALVSALLYTLEGTYRDFFLNRSERFESNRVPLELIESYHNERERLARCIVERDEEIKRLKGTVDHLTTTVAALESSSSWQITAPFRTGRTWLSKWLGG